ncbi:MAG: menaquinone biosynthesis protein [Acidobacteria bacterium]|nr:menaquinone biosynthesis protein [Acidobacteriota bacterium]
MPRLRVSAISYLNTAPLMWDFEQSSGRDRLREEFDVSYTIPSRCAQMLAEEAADIGIIPVAAYATIPNLVILPDVAIASKGAVRSILLVSTKPIDEIRSVALDSSSRSSAALIQILFAKYWRQEVRYVSAEPDLIRMLSICDAALLIGDPALQVDRSRYVTWDLGEEWRAFTGKPFVFAFWAARAACADERELSDAAQVFRESRDQGLHHIAEIAAVWAPKLRLSKQEIARYLEGNIHYFLDQENLAGMQLFFRYATELGILPPVPELRIASPTQNRNSTEFARF